MKHLIVKTLFALALCAFTLLVACTKESVVPLTQNKSTDLYRSLLPLWEVREFPQWHTAVQQYAAENNYSLINDSLAGGFHILTYLCQNDTGIYVLRTYDLHDTLWSLHFSLFSRRQQWMQQQTARYEDEMYSRHPADYTGGSFYWYIGPGSVDGGDVRSHDLFHQRVQEHAADVWEWVEARTRYGLHPPYMAEEQVYLHTDGTRHYLLQLPLDSIPAGITHHLDINFNSYDTTGWSSPWFF